MTEATRLVDELTTLLYEVLKRWEVQGRVCEIVQCGACRRKADKPESVVHERDCPVYRLQRAEESNTAVIRANAEEIADLEDARDELEARVNAVVVEIEHERKMFAALTDASVRRIDALTAERDELRSLLRDRSPLFQDYEDVKAERDAALARAEADRAALQACVGAISAGVAELPTGGMTGGGERPYSETWRNFDRALRMARVALAAAAPGEGESPTWPHVMAFAKRMEGKLAKNRHKGDRAGWLADHPGDLLRRIRDEANELENAILSDHSSEDVWQEAADVANFALMVADSYAARQGGGDE